MTSMTSMTSMSSMTSMRMQVQRERLSNRLRIVTQPIPWSKTVAVGVWVGAGSGHERESEKGMAHFIEHMSFKGTQTRSVRQIARTIDSIGGFLDAFTDKEVTCYYFRVMPEYLPKALELLSDLISNSTFDEKDIELEKQVVLAEIQGVQDAPDDLVQDLFAQALWGEHPLAHPVLGTEATVKSFTSKRLRKFLRSHYTPDNIIVVGTGDLNHQGFVELVARYFGELKGRAERVHNGRPKCQSLMQVVNRDTEQLYFCVGTEGYSRLQPEHFTAILMDTIIGGGASSRLFQEVREKRGLAYAIGSVSSSMKIAGFFAVAGSCHVANFFKVMLIVRKQLDAIQKHGVKKDELDRAKAQAKTGVVVALESVTNTMLWLGREELYFQRSTPVEEVLNRLEAITQDDIAKTASTLFNGAGFSLAAVGPLDEKNLDRVMGLLNGGD